MKNLKMPVLTGKPMAITEAGMNALAQIDFEQTLEKYKAALSTGGDLPGAKLSSVQGGTARINIVGPIFHYKNMMTAVFGYPSCEQIMEDLKAAQNNPSVDKIILYIDSNGGELGGVAELANYIRDNIKKPVVAYVGDMAASAAYWVASAADSIIAAPTAEIGSIGVVITMRRRQDNSVEIVSSVSPKKRVDPETDEGRAVLQVRADALAGVFIGEVAKHRGLTSSAIEFIQGDVLIAQTAVDMGLVDAVDNFEGATNADKTPVRKQAPKANFMNLVEANKAKETGCKLGEVMSTVVAEYPDIHEAWLMEQQQPSRATPRAAIARSGGRVDFMAEVDKYRAAHNCKRSEAIGAMVAEHPESHRAWLLSQQG